MKAKRLLVGQIRQLMTTQTPVGADICMIMYQRKGVLFMNYSESAEFALPIEADQIIRLIAQPLLAGTWLEDASQRRLLRLRTADSKCATYVVYL